jgi:transposase InsO family protein
MRELYYIYSTKLSLCRSKLRDDVLNREVFYSVREAKVIVENWRLEYNNHRPQSRLDYMPPAAFAASFNPPGFATLRLPDCRMKNMDNSLIKVGT